MSKIRNADKLSDVEFSKELEKGGKFVVFEYAISLLIVTFKRSSDVYFIKAGESTFQYSILYTLITILLGWWGIPWGPIYSIGSILTNVSGGKDITHEILKNPA
jgi:hypothetical protein